VAAQESRPSDARGRDERCRSKGTHLKLEDAYPLDEEEQDVVHRHLLRELSDDFG
jgi:hypothetical protein